jgi:DUF917 family protein
LRLIGEEQLEDIALGAGVLGTGGGGDPYIGKLLARQAIREHGPVTVLDVEEVPDDALVIPGAMMGAPTVLVEKLPSGDEVVRALRNLERHLGRRATHTMSIEIGGINSVIPICLAARAGVPLIDADLMGRAFPELQMCMPSIYGKGAAPIALADEKGNAAVIEAIDNLWAERLARSITIDMGCAAYIALYPMTGADLRQHTIAGTLGLAQEIGQLVRETRARHEDPIAALLRRLDGFELYQGKVVDVHRRTEGGFARSTVSITGLDGHEGTSLMLQTQNEHLVAQVGEEVLACVPDLIAVLDSETAQPITTEELRYGFRVTVIGLPCDPRWRSEAGLQLVGPRYFGYEFDYVPIEQRAAARAVSAPAG